MLETPERQELERLVAGWLRHIDSGCSDTESNEDFLQATDYLPEEDPERAWAVILRGVELASSEETLGVIGAGALESLVNSHGGAFIDRIEERWASDPRFRIAVAHVWAKGDLTVRERIQRLRHGGEGKGAEALKP